MLNRKVKVSIAIIVCFIVAIASILLINRSAKTTFSNVTIETSEVPQYGKFEISFDLSATYDNPFNPEEADVVATFLTPSGQQEVMPAFYQSHLSPHWAIRYSPREIGEHSVILKVKDQEGIEQTQPYTFTASSSEDNRGFMGVKGNRFVDSYGKQLTLLGTNYAWSKTGEILEAMPQYKQAKMNIMRVWYNVWWGNYAPEWGPITTTQADITMEYEGIGRYQLDNQARMDTLMETAEANDIYIMLTMNSFGDFWYDWEYHAYNTVNGGPSTWTENNTDFWTNPVAIDYQKKLLRYVFARWGYSRSLGMLEYWNESDNRVDTGDNGARIRTEWHNTMDNFWKSLDFYNRPTTTSFAWRDHGEFDKVTWEELNTLDTVNRHWYVGDDDAAEQWEAELKRMLSEYGDRPVFIGEAGKSHSDISLDPLLPNYYHDGVWVPIFRAGAAGANMSWIMDQGHLDQSGFNLPIEYKAIYTALANFIQPEEKYLIDMVHVDYGLQDNDIKIGGFKSEDRALLWINDTLSPYKKDPRIIQSGMTFTVQDMSQGTYQVMYYDTYSGTPISSNNVSVTEGQLHLDNIPSFSRDMAVKITPIE